MERVPRRAAGCADRRSRLEQYQPHAAAQPRRRRAEGLYPRYAQPDRSDHWREIDRLVESERLCQCRHHAGDGWRRHRLYDRRDGFRHRVAAQYTGRAAHSPPLSVVTVDMGQNLARMKSPPEIAALWLDYVLELAEEARANASREATIVVIGIHPFVVGTPDGAAAMRRVLTRLKTDPSVWLTNTASILKAADGKRAPDNLSKA